jgi:hypothetical protein
MTDAQGANAELSAKRAQWQEWARQQFRGDEAQIQAVADAALRAALGGASSQEAAAAARDAAASVGATQLAGASGGSGQPQGRPAPTAPGSAPVPPGHDSTMARPPTKAAWYRRPLVLLAIGVAVLVLIGLLIWGISTQLTGPSTPTTTVVPATSTTTQQSTTKRTRKQKSTSSTSPTPSATSSGTVTISTPSSP